MNTREFRAACGTFYRIYCAVYLIERCCHHGRVHRGDACFCIFESERVHLGGICLHYVYAHAPVRMQVNKSGEHIGARRIYRFQRDALAADDIIKIERPLFKGTFFGIVNLSADNSCFHRHSSLIHLYIINYTNV